MNDFVEAEKKSDNRTRNIILGVVAALVVLCGCLVVVAAGVIAIDPFGWNLLDQLFGGADDAAAVMPPDTTMFVGIDLLEMTPEKIGRIVDPFLTVAGEPDVPDFATGLDQIDAEMLDEFGFTFQDDILPWLGRFGGFGISKLEIDSFGDPEEVKWSLVVSTRDEDAADAFLVKLRDAVSEESGYDFVTTTYEGVSIYELDALEDLERVAMARSDGLVLFGAGAVTIQANIDAQSGDSLAEGEQYRTLTAELPGDRALTFFVDASFYESFQEQLQQDLPLGVDPSDIPGLGSASVASSLSLTEEGLQIDAANLVDRESMSQNQQQMIDAMTTAPITDQLFPDSTVVYIAGQHLDLVWASIRDSISTFMDPAEFDESMQLFAEEFGINPDTDLFPLLDGEWAAGVMPSNAGLLPEELGVDLGLAMVAHTSDPDTLSTNLSILSEAMEQQFFFVEPTTEGEIRTYTVREGPQGPGFFNFGIGQSYMFISSDNDTIARVFSEGPSLADSSRYQEVWNAFPGGMSPVIYMDVSGLIGAIREGMDPADFADFDEVAQFLGPIPTFAVATESGDDVIHTTAIVFITTTE